MKNLTHLSWLVLVLAIAAWCGVAYFDYWVQKTALQKGKVAVSAEQRAANAAHLARVQSLVRETQADRERLETLLQADIVTIADRIERAGDDVGVGARVGAAIPIGGAQEIAGGAPLRTVSFIIQAEGTFSGLVRLVKALEKFPGFSSVEQFDFERAGDAGSRFPWRASMRLQIETTSNISS